MELPKHRLDCGSESLRCKDEGGKLIASVAGCSGFDSQRNDAVSWDAIQVFDNGLSRCLTGHSCLG